MRWVMSTEKSKKGIELREITDQEDGKEIKTLENVFYNMLMDFLDTRSDEDAKKYAPILNDKNQINIVDLARKSVLPKMDGFTSEEKKVILKNTYEVIKDELETKTQSWSPFKSDEREVAKLLLERLEAKYEEVKNPILKKIYEEEAKNKNSEANQVELFVGSKIRNNTRSVSAAVEKRRQSVEEKRMEVEPEKVQAEKAEEEKLKAEKIAAEKKAAENLIAEKAAKEKELIIKLDADIKCTLFKYEEDVKKLKYYSKKLCELIDVTEKVEDVNGFKNKLTERKEEIDTFINKSEEEISRLHNNRDNRDIENLKSRDVRFKDIRRESLALIELTENFFEQEKPNLIIAFDAKAKEIDAKIKSNITLIKVDQNKIDTLTSEREKITHDIFHSNYNFDYALLQTKEEWSKIVLDMKTKIAEETKTFWEKLPVIGNVVLYFTGEEHKQRQRNTPATALINQLDSTFNDSVDKLAEYSIDDYKKWAHDLKQNLGSINHNRGIGLNESAVSDFNNKLDSMSKFLKTKHENLTRKKNNDSSKAEFKKTLKEERAELENLHRNYSNYAKILDLCDKGYEDSVVNKYSARAA